MPEIFLEASAAVLSGERVVLVKQATQLRLDGKTTHVSRHFPSCCGRQEPVPHGGGRWLIREEGSYLESLRSSRFGTGVVLNLPTHRITESFQSSLAPLPEMEVELWGEWPKALRCRSSRTACVSSRLRCSLLCQDLHCTHGRRVHGPQRLVMHSVSRAHQGSRVQAYRQSHRWVQMDAAT